MGMKMNRDIHSPSVPSSSSTVQAPDGEPGSRQALLTLMNEREGVEAELKALADVLTSHRVDMDTPLLTPDGFPRSDIDVAQIRTTRARIVWLRNDYKTLMSKIEAGLHAHHANLLANPTAAGSTIATTAASTSAADDPTTTPPQIHAFSNSGLEPPFAKVNSIVHDSPADAAGLVPGDEIRRFGTANWTNHERLTQVAQIVQRSEGAEILVKVKRASSGGTVRELDLKLTPRRNWGGRGMLGCHLVPM